jgi:phosphoglycolate phosphatase
MARISGRSVPLPSVPVPDPLAPDPLAPDPLAIVFDLDGTLIDSAPEIHAVANRVFTAKGLLPMDFPTVRGAIGNGVGVLVGRLLQAQGQKPGGPLQADLVASFVKIYEEAFDLTTVYPGVVEALANLHAAGHPMGVCTNKPEGPAKAVLRHFGLDRLFSVVVGGDTLPVRKPDPAPLRLALAGLNVRTGLFVGDSEVDSATAHAARIPLALYTQGYRLAPVGTLGASFAFDDFHALPRLVAGFSLQTAPEPR